MKSKIFFNTNGYPSELEGHINSWLEGSDVKIHHVCQSGEKLTTVLTIFYEEKKLKAKKES